MADRPESKASLPFLRWAGGKRWLARILCDPLAQVLESSKGRYIEPFLGAGAMFFALAPTQSILSDTNSELIECFKKVRDDPASILSNLRRIRVSAKAYYNVRRSVPKTDNGRAVRFIYLNRTCYGGLYRTNLKGQFNVPYGGGSRTPVALWRDGILNEASRALKESRCVLRCWDFEKSLGQAREGDVVYCDPTYRGMNRGAFDRYGATIFGWEDQERLTRAAQAAMQRGALVLVSNSVTDELRDLYTSALQLKLRRSKTIGNKALSESSHNELLAIFDPHRRTDFWISNLSEQAKVQLRSPRDTDSKQHDEKFAIFLLNAGRRKRLNSSFFGVSGGSH
jgi:DNA adenine methylase